MIITQVHITPGSPEAGFIGDSVHRIVRPFSVPVRVDYLSCASDSILLVQGIAVREKPLL
jgi:hypothetical protein